MAQYRYYTCTKCGNKIMASPSHEIALFVGVFYSYHCSNCKKIIELSSREINESAEALHCKECNADGTLSPWSPRRGGCPECGSRLNVDKDTREIMAD